jgi:hypothetical protein
MRGVNPGLNSGFGVLRCGPRAFINDVIYDRQRPHLYYGGQSWHHALFVLCICRSFYLVEVALAPIQIRTEFAQKNIGLLVGLDDHLMSMILH